MRVLLAPMPAGLRLQLRRLLRDVPGIEVAGQMLGGSSLAQTVRASGAQCLLLDAEQVPTALLQEGLAHADLRCCLLLHQEQSTAALKLPRHPKLALLERPPTLDDEQADGPFARALRQGLGADVMPLQSGNSISTTRPGPASAAAEPLASACALVLGPAKSLATPPAARRLDVLAIGSSTGGPQALQVLFAGLASFGLPIAFPVVVTQHMTVGFVGALAASLQTHTGIPTREAEDGMLLQPGQAYLAPGGRHLRLERLESQPQNLQLVCKLDDGPPENYCKPAVDVMLRSLAQAAPLRTLVVMLTGMGQDGLLGCTQLHADGATILAQDQASSVVWGMPGAVAQAGICRAVLPLEQLAARVLQRTGA